MALIEGGETRTFAQLWQECRAAASALIERGVRNGDRIAIWAPNNREFVVAAIAAQTCGAAIVPLNTRLKGREAGDILCRTQARMLFTVTGFLGIDYPALLADQDLPSLHETLLLDRDFTAFLASGHGADDHSVDAALATVTSNHISDIMFTSGTTGVPKGVLMTHGGILPQVGVWIGNTCGAAIPGNEVIVAGPDGRELPRGETGVMTGYLDDLAATAEAVDAEGWLHTGDVGTMDENGYVRITDRMKDMFISGGFNVYPAEVEKLLAGHPAVAMVAVIGVPDERMGEVGKAFVVVRSGTKLDEAEMISWSSANMAN